MKLGSVSNSNLQNPHAHWALSRLRTMLRDPLFIRERYGMKPTPKAEQLAAAIAAALANLDAVILGQQQFDPAAANQLFTIAPNSYVELMLMPTIVARLGERAPGTKVRLTPFGTDLAETGVTSGQTSVVLGRIEEAPDNLVVQHLMDESLACVVRADHPRVGKRISKKEFEQLKHVNVLPPGRLRSGLFSEPRAPWLAPRGRRLGHSFPGRPRDRRHRLARRCPDCCVATSRATAA
jgi:DNA-binding transcriptional LysR family regulator